ncbi:MAG TPA: hypothetical protein VJ743_04110 [Albitalea sp.]|nr:hypothetical protein [Albitalea sp.]
MKKTRTNAAAAAVCIALAGCGGGGADTPASPGSGAQDVGTPTPTLSARIAAATATAESSTNLCAGIGPFYWEIGNGSQQLAGGSVTRPSDPTLYTASTPMSIASASKWMYSAYVVQRQPVLTQAAIKFLTFRSGYTHFSACLPGQTVQDCEDTLRNGEHDELTDGKFYYGGGHMQKHATLTGLGPLDDAALASEMRSQLGIDLGIGYAQPQLAGGVVTTPGDYARFLRKLMDGTLELGRQLGTNAVCTNPDTCADALYTPLPAGVNWHYSLGHWVEDDGARGDDGSFSSAGAFGFYPWIDATRSTYGIVARQVEQGAGWDSAQCGRQIRRAWMTGTAQ